MRCDRLLFPFVMGLTLSASPGQAKDTSGFHGFFEVDPDSGAASLYFPLGPGIGRPGLRYLPALVGRFAPQVGRAPLAFELSPGLLEWPLVPVHPDETPPAVRWTYPDGTGGCADGPCPGDLAPDEVLARFGYAPPARQDHLPHLGSAPQAPLALTGAAGERLLALATESTVPVATPPVLRGNPQGEGRWALPACLLVVRGELAYEFRHAAPPRHNASPGIAHYRLTAMRAPSGESVTFAYDPNGLDFEAAWTDAKVRVALEAAEGVVPVLALDAGFPALDLKAPSETFRNVEARLRVTYVGSQTAAPGYTVGILLRAEDLTPSEPSVDGLQDVSTGSKALPPAFQNPLQVSRVQADASGETVSFTYGKAPTVSLAGPDGTLHYAPTVLREIALPQRSLRLDWEPQALPDAFAQFGGDQGLEPRWSFGLEAVSEEGAPTYRRTAPGECAPTATQPVSSFSFTERPAPPGPEETGVPSWVRQSRHFAFASTPGTGGACKTFVRDRWILQETGRKPNPGPLQTHRSFAGNDDGDIPTFEWDPRERSLIPVPGEMTRRLDWEPGTNHPPDPHRAGHRDRTAAWGLMGGMMPAGDGSGAHPAGALGGTVRLTPIQCDPIRHEAIMGAIAGGSVAPQLFWAPSSVDLFTQQVAGNFQNIQQGMQRDLAAAADRQALSTHQSVLAQAAHDARMATIQGQMAGRAQAQIEQAQARSQAWPHPPEGADAASLRERFQPRFEALDRIQEDLQRVRETQDQVEASHQRIAEGLNRVAENRRLAKEAKKLAEAQRNKEKVAGAGVFWLNRKISGDTPKIGFISHTFTFTTNPDGTLLHTYSWGNQGFNGAWIQDAIDDRIAANKALNDPQYFNFISGADFVPDVDRAFRALAGMSSEAHKNFIITSNCKDETDALVNMAIRIHSSTKP